MAVSFPRFPRWLWSGGSKQKESSSSNGSFLTPSSDTINLPAKKKQSTARKTKRRWLGRQEEKTDNVVFPEPGGPEWSIGWVEPHGPGFGSGEEGDGGFVVLVPCYKKVVDGSNNQFLGGVNNMPPPNGFSPDGMNYMEQWLSSLKNL